MMDLEEQFNFTNKLKHPTNDLKTVYRHYNQEQAQYFEELLTKEGISFESQVDEEHIRKPRYFGVATIDERRADHLNNLALGKNRAKFIASAPVRWFIIIVSMSILLTAVIGALTSS